MFSLEQLIILFVIGLVASILGTLAGGGGLLTLPSLLMIGLPIQSAIGINKFSGFVSSLSGIPFVLKHKNMSVRELCITIFLGLAGGSCGAAITTHLSTRIMNIVAFVLLLFAFMVTILGKGTAVSVKPVEERKPLVDKFINTFISVYDGAFGPGSATLIMIFWIKAGKAYIEAVQRSRMLVLGSALGSFVVFEWAGYINWFFAITMGIASVVGTQIALVILPKIRQTTAKRFLLVITGILIIQIGWKVFSQ
ncbi:sulfite exporter TauE/SafE family protein [Paenibacillus sp. GP183]|jgi:uncharacterized membrane protein YfcA|uniref:sulfite exporter TauE/SafE family protein n=1 Tax=Paenibacillus sp. GP183 TaxID=1882751 RepID=UPI0008961250|nr:sulfite exporter TauE/SafE family protein [Paenibacillus sp. GP183]SEC00839.1 hypothetical protein SAMN05443246_2650 [Paenibacillus sp. GP183]